MTHPEATREIRFRLDAPGALAEVWPSGCAGHWNLSASYSDGSGTIQHWAPTKRGAMMRAINEWRRKARNYKPMKFKWVPVEHPKP